MARTAFELNCSPKIIASRLSRWSVGDEDGAHLVGAALFQCPGAAVFSSDVNADEKIKMEC
jgi:hypothetical protein